MDRRARPARPQAPTSVTDRCPVCGGAGWYLDYAGGGNADPATLELLPCIYPPCEASGRPVEHVSVQHLAFTRPVVGPDGTILAIGR